MSAASPTLIGAANRVDGINPSMTELRRVIASRHTR
jgi:hypothetical protein